MSTREALTADVATTVGLLNDKVCEAITLCRLPDAIGYAEALAHGAAALDLLDTGSDED
jgi:hypothetical protein